MGDIPSNERVASIVQIIDMRIANSSPSNVMLGREDWDLLRSFVLKGAALSDRLAAATWLESMHDYAAREDQPFMARAAAVLRDSVETSGVDPNYKLPCDVRLPLAMSISKGCPLSTLMNAFRFREGWSEEDTHFQDERGKAVRRSITELLNDRDRLNAEMAGRVLGDPRESVEIGGKGPTIWQNSDSSEKSSEQPSAPAVVRPTLSEPPSLGSAAGVDLTVSKPAQHIPGALRCEKHGVTFAFDGDTCWACQEESNAPINS